MAGLQGLEEQYEDQGLHVLGFYSNDFGSQGGTDEQIDACTEAHAVSFPQFEIQPVTLPNARPVFAWLLGQDEPGPAPLTPSWNFHKYLVARDGTLVATFSEPSYMGSDPASPTWQNHEIVLAIEAELAK